MSERFLCEFKGIKWNRYVYICVLFVIFGVITIFNTQKPLGNFLLFPFLKIVSKFVLVVNLIYIFAHGIFTRVYYYAYCYFYDIVIEP